jgi:uncharacterized protein
VKPCASRSSTVKQVINGFVSKRVLKFNVGFLLAAGAGSTHDISFDVPVVRVAEDLDLQYVRGDLRLSRTQEGILAQGTLSLGYEADCFRCVSSITSALVVDIEELFAYPHPNGSEFRVTEDGNMDLAPMLRAEALIEDSRGILCRPDCKGLCVTCGANLNDGQCDCDADIDPRMAALKALLKP